MHGISTYFSLLSAGWPGMARVPGKVIGGSHIQCRLGYPQNANSIIIHASIDGATRLNASQTLMIRDDPPHITGRYKEDGKLLLLNYFV